MRQRVRRNPTGRPKRRRPGTGVDPCATVQRTAARGLRSAQAPALQGTGDRSGVCEPGAWRAAQGPRKTAYDSEADCARHSWRSAHEVGLWTAGSQFNRNGLPHIGGRPCVTDQTYRPTVRNRRSIPFLHGYSGLLPPTFSALRHRPSNLAQPQAHAAPLFGAQRIALAVAGGTHGFVYPHGVPATLSQLLRGAATLGARSSGLPTPSPRGT